MLLFIFTYIYLLIVTVFLCHCYGVPSFHLEGVRMVDLIVFIIGTYIFNVFSIIRYINDG